jgi:hypothetical protein
VQHSWRMYRPSHTNDIRKHLSPRFSILATQSPPRALYSQVYTATVVMVRRCAALIHLAVAADWIAPRRNVSITWYVNNRSPHQKYDLGDRQYNRYACLDTSTRRKSNLLVGAQRGGSKAVLRYATSQPNVPVWVLMASDGKHTHPQWYISMYR